MDEALQVEELHQVMLYVGGSKTAFRCECGCNVMHVLSDKEYHYACNGCGLEYTGEKDEQA